MSRPEIERVVRRLAALERPSASDGERRAAELLADESYLRKVLTDGTAAAREITSGTLERIAAALGMPRF
jgi:hypothetical protein